MVTNVIPIDNAIWTGTSTTASSSISYLPISRDTQDNVVLHFDLSEIRDLLLSATSVTLQLVRSAGSGNDKQNLYINAINTLTNITLPATAYQKTTGSFYKIGLAQITYNNGYSSWNINLSNLKTFLNENSSSNNMYLLLFGVTQSLTSTYYDIEADNTKYKPTLIITSENSSETPTLPPLAVSPTSASVQIGDTIQLTATPATAAITWLSYDSSIAIVSSSGLVTGVAAGTTLIEVSATGFTSAYCTINVETIPTLSITPSSATIEKGGTVQLSTTPTTADITWSSSNTNVATVANGTITGIAAGNVTITAAKTGYQSATSLITVTNATEAITFNITPTSQTIAGGQAIQFTVTTNATVGYSFAISPAVAGCHISNDGFFWTDGNNTTQLTCNVYAYLNNNSHTAQAAVTITPAPSWQLSSMPENVFFVHNTDSPEIVELWARIAPDDTAIDSYLWYLQYQFTGTNNQPVYAMDLAEADKALANIDETDCTKILQDKNTLLAYGSIGYRADVNNSTKTTTFYYYVGQLDLLDSQQNAITSAASYTLNPQQTQTCYLKLLVCSQQSQDWLHGSFGAEYDPHICNITINAPSSFTTENNVGSNMLVTYTITGLQPGKTIIRPYYMDENNLRHYTQSITVIVPSPIYYHDGSAWESCSVYYRQNGVWIPCNAYYRQNNTWQTLR